jgi:hypothetical protein
MAVAVSLTKLNRPLSVATILADSATIIIVIAVALNVITGTRRGLLDSHHQHDFEHWPEAFTRIFFFVRCVTDCLRGS